jgi:hypothetical protein
MMDIRAHKARKLTVTAVLSACIVTLMATTLAAQTAPTVPFFPAAPEGCRVWEAHVLYVIEKHRREGTPESALGEAFDRAYAMYAKCVMGRCDMNGAEAVAALEGIHHVLERGRAVALVAPARESAAFD